MSLEGGDALIRRLHAVGDGRQFLGRTGLLSVRYAKDLVHRRTGNLGRTIRLGTVTDDYAEVKAGGQNRVGYAAAEEMGRRAIVIVPRNARVLAWGGKRTLSGRQSAGGRPTHFAMRVQQPARKGHPFLRPGVLKAVRDKGADIIVELWNRAA